MRKVINKTFTQLFNEALEEVKNTTVRLNFSDFEPNLCKYLGIKPKILLRVRHIDDISYGCGVGGKFIIIQGKSCTDVPLYGLFKGRSVHFYIEHHTTSFVRELARVCVGLDVQNSDLHKAFTIGIARPCRKGVAIRIITKGTHFLYSRNIPSIFS